MTTAIIGILFSVIVTLAILGFVVYFVYTKIIKPSQQARHLLQTGQPARAKVISLADTGVTVNDNPQVMLTLEVNPEGGYPAPYQTVIRTLISRLHIPQFQPGCRLRVRFDPNNPPQVAVEGVDQSPAPGNQ